MTRALPLRQRQITALAKGAAKAGCVAEVKIGDLVVRLIPEHLAQAGASDLTPVANEEDFRL